VRPYGDPGGEKESVDFWVAIADNADYHAGELACSIQSEWCVADTRGWD
jgi:hypothetical protein